MVDFDSPPSVEFAARTIERAGSGTLLTFTEMLPAPAHLWLADTAGRRYTSELRCTAVLGGAAQAVLEGR